MNKKDLRERDICTKFITPAVERAGWDVVSQIREEVGFTRGRIIVRGKLVTRGKAKRADYILYYKPNIPIALIEEGSRLTLRFTPLFRGPPCGWSRSESPSSFLQQTALAFTQELSEIMRHLDMLISRQLITK